MLKRRNVLSVRALLAAQEEVLAAQEEVLAAKDREVLAAQQVAAAKEQALELEGTQLLDKEIRRVTACRTSKSNTPAHTSSVLRGA